MPPSAEPETVLVTGATGFLGRRLVARLGGERAVRVVAASRSGVDIEGAQGVRLDLEDEASMANLPRRVDHVVHLAALIDSDDLYASLRVNVLGTAHLLDYAQVAGARTFVHGSTGGVYGSGRGWLRETDTPAPQDRYGLSKAQAEEVVAWFPGTFQKIVLRYCAPYGIGTPNPMSRIVSAVLAGQTIDVTSAMTPRFNPLYVSDAIEMTVRALRLVSDAVLNISGTEVTTFAGVALIAAAHLGLPARLRHVPLDEVPEYHRADTLLDGATAWRILDHRPVVPLVEGIAKMADDLRAAAGGSR